MMETIISEQAIAGGDSILLLSLAICSLCGSDAMASFGPLHPNLYQTAIVIDTHNKHVLGEKVWMGIKKTGQAVKQTVTNRPVRTRLFPRLFGR